MKYTIEAQIAALALIILTSFSYATHTLATLPSSVVLAQVVAPTSNLTAYWSFDAGSGTSASDSVGGHTATFTGSPAWTTGKVNGALSFGGAAYASAPYSTSAYNFSGSQSYTISAWVNPSATTAGMAPIFSTMNGGGDGGYTLALDSSNELWLFVRDTVGAASAYSAGTVPLNTWSYVAVVVTSPTSVTFYINGVASGSATLSLTMASVNAPATIGYNANVNAFFQGSIDELRVYSSALTSTDISNIYTSGGGVVSGGGGGGGDTIAPTVSLTSPGSSVTGSITLSATAADNVGVVGVQFKVNGANIGSEDTSSPYSVQWDSTTVANGTYNLTATARDGAGNTSTSNTVTVTVTNAAPPSDTTPPTITLSSPGSSLTGTVSLSANASDNIGVAGVQFKVDGNNISSEDTSSPYSVTFDSTQVSNGSHTLTATARDAAGNTTTSNSVAVTVSNSVAVGSNVYVAQNAAGSADGSSCGNAVAVSYMGTASNWTAGKVFHLCGTLTTPIDAKGSGTAGSPITIYFESGAKYSAPTWTANTPIISIYNRNYVIVDGGLNGTIEATDNGVGTNPLTGAAYKNNNKILAIDISASPNTEIKNMTLKNLHGRFAGSTDQVGTNGIVIDYTSSNAPSSGTKIHDNKISEVENGIMWAFDAGGSNAYLYNNTIHNMSTGIIFGSKGNQSSFTNVYVYGNDISDTLNWDEPSDAFHHDGVHFWNYNTQSPIQPLRNVYIYNNYFHGTWGTYVTAQLYFEGHVANYYIYNNVLATPFRHIYSKMIGSVDVGYIYNNLMYGTGFPLDSAIGGIIDFRNNIMYNTANMGYDGNTGVSPTVSFVNNLLSVDPQWVNPAGGDFHLKSTSPAINAGTSVSSSGSQLSNLFSVDKDGNNRPSGSTWDIGPYEYGGTVTQNPVNGVCSTTVVNSCTAGTFLDQTDSGTQALWQCTGSAGGSTASCTLPLSSYSTGDFNHDGLVNSLDMSLMSGAWNTSNSAYDLNHDGTINTLDYSIMVRNWSF